MEGVMRNTTARIETTHPANEGKSNPLPVTAETRTVADQEHHAEACLQFFVQHLQACGRDTKTVAAYEADIKIFRTAVGKDLIEVDREDVYRAIEQWKQAG